MAPRAMPACRLVAASRRLTLDLSFMTPGSLPSGVAFTRASTATYFDATGTLQTAAINAPRWDYDPVTLVLNGLLIEEARTNIDSAIAVCRVVACDKCDADSQRSDIARWHGDSSDGDGEHRIGGA